jgi:hypothetical protein
MTFFNPTFVMERGNFECRLWRTEGFIYQYTTEADGNKTKIAKVKFQYIADELSDLDDAFTDPVANDRWVEPVFSHLSGTQTDITSHESAENILIHLLEELANPSPVPTENNTHFSMYLSRNIALLTLDFNRMPYAYFQISHDAEEGAKKLYQVLPDGSKLLIKIIENALPKIFLNLHHVKVKTNSCFTIPNRPPVNTVMTRELPACANDR